MIEIALCLAIIGFALVSILLVLPSGMNTQRDTREETVISQDASMLLEAIRNGERGLDDLTNNVYAITNYWTLYRTNGSIQGTGVNGYTYNNVTPGLPAPYATAPLTNGMIIIGLLSTPEFVANVFIPPFINYPAVPNLFFAAGQYSAGCYSNHVVAYIHSMSGLAAEKPPQNNDIMIADDFSYRLFCVNAPMPMDTNLFNLPAAQRIYASQLAANQHELRLTFLWPQLPNGHVGPFRQTFRVSVGGQLAANHFNGQWLYFYQPRSFTNAP